LLKQSFTVSFGSFCPSGQVDSSEDTYLVSLFYTVLTNYPRLTFHTLLISEAELEAQLTDFASSQMLLGFIRSYKKPADILFYLI